MQGSGLQSRSVNLDFIMNKQFRTLVGVSSLLALVGGAHAAVPAEVTAAIGDMKADGVAVATAFIVAVIAVAAIKFLRSAK